MATSSSRSLKNSPTTQEYAGNEQVMVAQIKRATRKTSKNTIYAADGELPVLYNDWKVRLLHIDYNWRLKQAESMGRPVPTLKGMVPKGVASTNTPTQKTATGTTYGGRGEPMDIGAATATTKCYQCRKLGHFKCDCLPCQNPEQKHSVDAIPTGTKRRNHWSQSRR